MKETEVNQLQPFAYIWLLNKFYEVNGHFQRANPTLKVLPASNTDVF